MLRLKFALERVLPTGRGSVKVLEVVISNFVRIIILEQLAATVLIYCLGSNSASFPFSLIANKISASKYC